MTSSSKTGNNKSNRSGCKQAIDVKERVCNNICDCKWTINISHRRLEVGRARNFSDNPRTCTKYVSRAKMLCYCSNWESKTMLESRLWLSLSLHLSLADPCHPCCEWSCVQLKTAYTHYTAVVSLLCMRIWSEHARMLNTYRYTFYVHVHMHTCTMFYSYNYKIYVDLTSLL